MRKVVCVAIIKDNRILLVKKKETWILPGGKPEIDEDDTACLLREISEELPLLKLQGLSFFNSFVGVAPHKGDEVCAEVYFADAEGEITPNAEISAAEWTAKPEEYNLSDITKKIITSLKHNGYL